MEGSLRQAGTKLRLAVQLADASSGAHLWAETYDRTFRPDEIFTLQDELVPRIVSTVADTYGVLPRSMSEALRNRDPEQLTPYESVLRSFAHSPRLSAEEHAAARAGLERAVQQSPGYADGWAMLSMLYREEYTHGFNVRTDPLGRAHAAARGAVEASPSNHLAYHALASAQFFRRELQAFRNYAERAIALAACNCASSGECSRRALLTSKPVIVSSPVSPNSASRSIQRIKGTIENQHPGGDGRFFGLEWCRRSESYVNPFCARDVSRVIPNNSWRLLTPLPTPLRSPASSPKGARGWSKRDGTPASLWQTARFGGQFHPVIGACAGVPALFVGFRSALSFPESRQHPRGSRPDRASSA